MWDKTWAPYLQHATQGNAFPAMLTISDRIQSPSKTTHKDKGPKVNTFYYFVSKINTAFGFPMQYRILFNILQGL